jgi:uncharacterized membrane protein
VRPTVRLLIALFTTSGTLHFLRPAPFVAIVPRRLPRKKELVWISGAAELVAAGLLVGPATRRAGGLLSAAVLVAVLPANVSMALRSGGRPAWFRALLWLRLPVQLPLIGWALRADQPAAVTSASS